MARKAHVSTKQKPGRGKRRSKRSLISRLKFW